MVLALFIAVLGVQPVGAAALNADPDVSLPTWNRGGVFTVNLTPSSVDLLWSGARDNVGVAGYKILVDGTEVDQSNLGVRTLTGLNGEVTYTVTIQAVDAAGNVSTDGPSTTFTTPAADDLPKWTRGKLTASAVGDTQVDLSWSGASDDLAVASYLVYADGIEVAEVTAPTLTTTVTGLRPSTLYQFNVEAKDAVGQASNDGPTTSTTTSGTVPVNEVARLLAANGSHDDKLGLAIDGDGATLITGAPYEDTGVSETGAAYVYVRDSEGAWSLQQRLEASDGMPNDRFGHAVAVHGDMIVVGAYFDDGRRGSAYVFERTDTVWTQVQKIVASDGGLDDRFGWAVDVDDSSIAVSSYLWDGADVNQGQVYVYANNGTAWAEQDKLTTPNPQAGNKLGWSLALDGDTIIAGGPQADFVNVTGTTQPSQGGVWVFTRSETSWSEQAVLTSSDGAPFDHFGFDVSLSGDVAMIGAPRNDDNGPSSGSIYEFVRTGTTWTEVTKVLAPDGLDEDRFGWSIKVDGNRAVVGAWKADTTGGETGAAYYLTRKSPGSWTVKKLLASDGNSAEGFGEDVTLIANGVGVGAWNSEDPTPGVQTSIRGSVYVFDPSIAEPVITVGNVTIAEGDSGTTTATIPLVLSIAQGSTVTVGYATSNGSASAASDYVGAFGTATFAAYETSETITVTINGDTTPELDEYFTVTLSNQTPGVALATGSAAVTITNDDGTVPAVTALDMTVVEQNAGTSQATVTFKLDSAPASLVSFDFVTAAGSATAGSDYTAASNTVTFAEGVTTATVAIEILGDAEAETDEDFRLALSNPVGLALAQSSMWVTITNDD